MVRAIAEHPADAAERLKELRLIVAERIDGTDSARETASLSRVMLDIEHALRSIEGAIPAASPVDELLARRAERGAR